MAEIRLEAFFLDGPRGPLFCMHACPEAGAVRHVYLYLHPFAEEMHKSRRMAALAARALAAGGCAVLQVDLSGCGDSWGDFGDATWETWREDARLAHAWLQLRHAAPVTLWGLRVGAALALDVAANLGASRLLLWQPVGSGEQFLNQFLRIRLASEMLAEGQARGGTQTLRAQLSGGETLEIGGYALHPDMARSLDAIRLADARPACAVDWAEVGGGAALSPASQRVVDAWRGAGVEVRAQSVPGEPFWVTQEITECAPLIEVTRQWAAA